MREGLKRKYSPPLVGCGRSLSVILYNAGLIQPAFSVEEGRVTAAQSTLERRLGKSMGRGGRIIPAPPPKLNKVGVLVGGCALLELSRNSDTNKIQKIKKCKTCLLVK